MERRTSYLRIRASSLAKADANCGPWLEMRVSWSPKRLNTWSKKSWAIPFASIVFEQGASITPFVRLWSTTTIRESWPCERGKSVIRSTESCLKGREEEDLMGESGGMTGCVLALFCWQTAQPATKLLTNTERPGHQKSHSNSLGPKVSKVTREGGGMDGVE